MKLKMQMNVTVQLSQREMRDQALRRQGISPATLAMKPVARVQATKALDVKKGRAKAKHRKMVDTGY